VILTGVFAALEQFFHRSIAEAMFECVILICVVVILIRGEMLVRNVLFSRVQSPIVHTIMFGVASLNLVTLMVTGLENGKHFTQDGELDDLGVFTVMIMLILSSMIFDFVWRKKHGKLTTNEDEFKDQEAIDDQNIGEAANTNPMIKRKSRQLIDEREQRIRRESYPLGFTITFIIFFIHSALKTLGIIWTSEFYAFIILSFCCITILLIIINARGGFSTRNGIILPLCALVNGLLILGRALYAILFLQEPWWTEDGLSIAAIYGILGVICLLLAIIMMVRICPIKTVEE
jgi:hypothetical protein